MNTIEITRLLRSRDEKGLAYIYDHYSGALNGIIVRILRSEKLAEEVLQQTFLKIWDKIDLYDESKSQLFTWMSRIARNTAIDAKRLKKYEHLQNTCTFDLNKHDEKKNHIGLDGMDVQSLVSKLDEKHKIVLDYVYLNGYTQSETAEHLGIPLGTVKSRVRKAMVDLRGILNDEKVLFAGSFTTIIILILLVCL